MEDIIIFAVIAISIVANIVSNFRKEAKKNAQRTIGQPVRTGQATRPQSEAQPQNVKKIYKKPAESLESIFSLEELHLNEEDYQAKKTSPFFNEIDNITEADYDTINTMESEITNEIADGNSNNPNFVDKIFNTKDDFKKAILYSAILERKF